MFTVNGLFQNIYFEQVQLLTTFHIQLTQKAQALLLSMSVQAPNQIKRILSFGFINNNDKRSTIVQDCERNTYYTQIAQTVK